MCNMQVYRSLFIISVKTTLIMCVITTVAEIGSWRSAGVDRGENWVFGPKNCNAKLGRIM